MSAYLRALCLLVLYLSTETYANNTSVVKDEQYSERRLEFQNCRQLDKRSLGTVKLPECGWWNDINFPYMGATHVVKVYQSRQSFNLTCDFGAHEMKKKPAWFLKGYENPDSSMSHKPKWFFTDYSNPGRDLTLPRKWSIHINETLLQDSTHFNIYCKVHYTGTGRKWIVYTGYDFLKDVPVTDVNAWESTVKLRIDPKPKNTVKEGTPFQTCVRITYSGAHGWGVLRGRHYFSSGRYANMIPSRDYPIIGPQKARQKCTSPVRARPTLSGHYVWVFYPYLQPGTDDIVVAKAFMPRVKSFDEVTHDLVKKQSEDIRKQSEDIIKKVKKQTEVPFYKNITDEVIHDIVKKVKKQSEVPFYKTVAFIAVVSGVAGFLVVVGVTGCLCLKYVRRKPKYALDSQTVFIKVSGEHDEDDVVVRETEVNINGRPPSDRYLAEGNYILPKDVWELDRKSIKMGPVIGEGQFGKVYYGRHRDGRKVAVKTLKDDAIEKDLADLLAELSVLEILAEKEHPNVIQFVGCLTKGKPVAVVTKYAAYGNLLQFMRRHWGINTMASIPCKPTTTFKMVEQIAAGMEYIAAQKIIHRDLAARNVLVTSDGVLQVADFGLTRRVSDKDYYTMNSRTPVPVKWMPPESLASCKFSMKSDVWSYGITMWEVYTAGGVPYNISDPHMLMDFLIRGGRLDKPRMMPDSMYSLVKATWADVPAERPTFTQIVGHLTELSNTVFGDAGYMEMMDDSTAAGDE